MSVELIVFLFSAREPADLSVGKRPRIVFGISYHGNNVKKCADLTQWPTDPQEVL